MSSILKGGRSMLNKLARFMMGRYGTDKLNIVLCIITVILSLIFSLIPGNLFFLNLVNTAFLVYVVFRTLSRNITARRKELYSFLKFYTPIENWMKFKITVFSNRKTYKYFTCPNCKQQLRAPRGRGKIRVTCQKCHKDFEKKV